MQFSHIQKQEIFEKGYVKVPGVVPQVMVNDAVKAINHSLGEGIDPEKLVTFRSQSFCPDVMHTPVIADLLNKTPARALAESALGEDSFALASGGQVALRFPSLQDPPGRVGCHLDGMYSPHNGVKKGMIQNFTMLVGVFLSEIPGPNCGNFTAWPGTHKIYEAYFREHGPESILEGMPKVDLPEPEQITARPGDVVFCHYQIAHGVAPNVSPNTRYAIFFRVSKHGHSDRRSEVMKDIWLEWDGMREFAENR